MSRTNLTIIIPLPLEDTLAYIGSGKPNDEQIDLLTNSMEILVGALGTVVSGIDQERH